MKTYKLIFLLIVFTTIGFSALAQMKQPGVVMEYRMWNKKKPLAGVEIDVKYAGSTYSDKKGQFTLQFNSLKPGDKVNVRRIEKNGFEIFNKEALDQWNLSSSGKPFTIIMARSKDMKSLRDNYSSLSSSSYKKQYEKEKTIIDNMLSEGKIKQQDYQKQLKELDDWYQLQLDKIENYVDHFSRFDLSEMSSEEAAIIKLVQQGKFEEAIRRYDQLRLTEKYNACVDNLNEIEHGFQVLKDAQETVISNKDSFYAMIQRHIDVLRLTGGRESFEKIGIMLKEIAEKDTQDLRVTYAYAKFLDEQKQYDEAIRYYRRCLSLVKDTFESISIQNDLGRLYLDTRDFNNAFDILQKVQISAKRQYDQSTKDYGRLMALIDYNYGLVNKYYMDYDKAERLLLESLSIFQTLNNNNPNVYRHNLADVSSALSSLYAITRDTQKAQDFSKEAMALYDTILSATMDTGLPSIARMLKSQLNFYFQKRDFSKIKPIAEKSYELISELYRDNPNVYRSDLCDVLNILGQNYAIQRQYDEAKSCFEKAQLLADTLCNDDSPIYLYQKLKTLNNLATISYMTKAYHEDSIYSKMAYDVCKSLYESDPVIYGPDMANMAYNQSVSFFQANDDLNAKALSDEAEGIYEVLFEKYPLVFGHGYISLLNLAARISDSLNDSTRYEYYTNQAYELSNNLYQKYPKDYLDLYVKSLDNIADHLMKSDVEQSLVYRLEGLKLINEMYQKEPELYVKTMGRMYLTTYLSYVFAKDYNNAMAMVDSALTAYQPFYEKEPQAFGMLMATCYFNKGRLAGTYIGENDLAIVNYQKAIPLYQTEMNRAIEGGKQSVAQDYMDYLWTIHLSLYDIYIDKELYSEALEQLDELLKLDPSNDNVRQEKQELEESLQKN